MLVLKKKLHKPGHFQYTIHYKGNHFLVYGHKKDLPDITSIFHLLKYEVKFFLVSAILHHISLLRLLPKSYLKISTLNFNPIFCALASFRTRRWSSVPLLSLVTSKYIPCFCLENKTRNKVCTCFDLFIDDILFY